MDAAGEALRRNDERDFEEVKCSMNKSKLPQKAWVKVSIEVPKQLHDFMVKFADLEGGGAEDWYTYWIRGDFESFLDELSGGDLDMRELIEFNDLKATLAERNPSFVTRFFPEEK